MVIRIGTGALWVVALYPFLVGTPALAQASFSNQMVTTQAPPSTGCVLPTPATSFLTTDNTVYLFFDATVTTSDSLTNDWLAPDSTVVAGGYWPSGSGEFCFTKANLSIGNLSAGQLGSWQARVYDNGNPLFSVPFTVAAPQSIAVTNAASLASEVSPGSLVSIFGNGNVLATTTLDNSAHSNWVDSLSAQGDLATAQNLPLPTSPYGTSVTMNGILCPLIYVSPSHIVLQAPMELQPGPATVIVNNNGQVYSTTIQVLAAAPGIFTRDGDGSPGIFRAGPGCRATMYFTGIGPITNNPGTGNAASGSPSWSQPTSTVNITFNGISVQPSFTRLAPGFVGLGEVNFQLPANTPSGNSIPLVLTINGVSSNTAHISVLGWTVASGTYTLTTGTSGTGSGTVSASPPGTSCGSGCLSFAAGTVVMLTATPSTGSAFAGWSGACSGTASCTVTMSSNQAVTATFSAPTAVQVSVSPAAATVETGNSTLFTAAVIGTNNTAVTWGVNNIIGGNATVGTISTSGLYMAPSAVPAPSTVTVAATSLANPSVSATASLAIQPMCQTPAAAMTDATGSATICSGGFTFPVQLVDADTGSGITTGLAVAVAVDGSQPGRALLVVADPSGSYPLQFHSLAAPSDPSQTPAVSGPLLLQANQAAAGSIPVPIQAGEGEVATLVEAPLPTGILANLPVPPPPPASTSDPYASNLVIRIGATLQNLSNGFNMRLPKLLQGVVSVSQSDPIQADQYNGQLLGEVTDDTGEQLVDMTGEPVGEEFGFEKGSLGTLLGNPEIDTVTAWIGLQIGYVSLAVSNVCEDLGRTEIVETRITVGRLKVAVPACYDPGPYVPGEFFPPKPNLTANVRTSNGAPVGADSLQFIKTDDLGFGFSAQIGNQGTAAIPVPAGSYTVRAGAIGFAPTSQSVSVPAGPSTLNLTLTPLTSQSLSFSPPGALPAATVGVPYPGFSFCTPVPAALCGVPPTTNPSGGQPPYHFQLGTMGGFPPMGMSLSLNGLLTGTPTVASTANFTVCAVDLSGASVCQPVSLTVDPALNLTITTSGTGGGTVGSSPAGTSCGSGCLSFATGTVVTLTATPNAGSAFAGWSGACSGTGTCTVTMSSNQAVTATFNLTSGTGIGVNGLNVTYIGASISCTNSGGFFDNCSGSVSLNVGVAIENGVVAVAMDQLNYGGGSNPYAAGTVPGLITVSIAGGDMPQGTCSAGTINTDIEVIDGYGDGTNVTIGYSASVPLTISCGAGA